MPDRTWTCRCASTRTRHRPLVLGRLADRCSSYVDGELACQWFEIVRHPPTGETIVAA